MNAVGIDVSKGKSTVAVLRPFGEVAASPFEVIHNDSDLKKLVGMIKKLPGESKVVMEYTGAYYEPIAQYLRNNGIFVSVINALLVHDYGKNSMRRAKTDKKDALKLASFALDRWCDLIEYTPVEDVRKALQILNSQYIQYTKILVMLKNNLISLLDSVFPGLNALFSAGSRESDGHEKWVDFALKFHHKECIASLAISAFKLKYKSWCSKNGYRYSESKAVEIYAYSRNVIAVLPCDESAELLVEQSCKQLNAMLETISAMRKELNRLAQQLPEYETVIGMFGVGKVLAPQLMAEIGDTRRFKNRRAITAFAGLDAPLINPGLLMSNPEAFQSVVLPSYVKLSFR